LYWTALYSVLVANNVQKAGSKKLNRSPTFDIYQIPTSRLCSECDHKAELKGAWMEIAKRLPHRSVQSVYRHGIRQLHPFKRGAWSDQECQTLQELVQRMGKKWAAIQAKLNRSADSCRDKYREMSDEFIKGRWKEQETESLKRAIREQLNVGPETDMKELGRMVEERGIQIPWSTISKRMGKRSRLSCFKKWQKMSGLFSPSDDVKRASTKSNEEMEHDILEPNSYKRTKLDHHTDGGEEPGSQQMHAYAAAATAGAAAAMAAAVASQQGNEYDVYSAKIAAETVEAVDLPDTDTLGVNV
jgi:hypothetical protein